MENSVIVFGYVMACYFKPTGFLSSFSFLVLFLSFFLSRLWKVDDEGKRMEEIPLPLSSTGMLSLVSKWMMMAGGCITVAGCVVLCVTGPSKFQEYTSEKNNNKNKKKQAQIAKEQAAKKSSKSQAEGEPTDADAAAEVEEEEEEDGHDHDHHTEETNRSKTSKKKKTN